MTWLDWCVIAIYMLGMLGIGAYYSFVNRDREGYLLGGRSLGAVSVGLSLFATLFSTNSYLCFPAEMILNGPMAFAMLLSYPLVYVIVAYGLIPHFVSLEVTSAYEVLERRFGTRTRLLGSVLFLALRLLWMGTVVYTATEAVLVPIIGLSSEATPYVCIAMSLVTIVYTTMGGLRAVVVTDSIQSFVLLAGAVLTLFVATSAIGGVGGWWPAEWPENWTAFNLRFDPSFRSAGLIVVLSQFTWWVATCGSDQMAIQRYLATRDLASARRMFGVSLVFSALTIGMLAFVGLALRAYYLKFPDQLGGMNLTTTNGSNAAFTQFIVHGLPAGVTGTIVAGLMAAAMSSLSSGFNSSSLVIAVDFFDRLGWCARTERQSLVRTQVITGIVGLLTVVLSLVVAKYGKGHNLLDLVFQNSNLMVSPLFLLFVFALFVPWATTFGVWCGVLAAVYVAIRIAFCQDFGFRWLGHYDHPLTFWIMPVSLVVGMVVGSVASLLPIGGRRPLLGLRDKK